jgi:hypothetical protein
MKFLNLIICFTLFSITFLGCKKEVITEAVDPIILDKDITSDKILTNINLDPEADDYIVTKQDLNVAAMLTIEPGVRIAFEANTSMKFPYTGKGSIIANGTSLLPIFFTGKTKSPGFWKGVLVVSADIKNSFQYCTFEYGGGATLLASSNPLCNLLIAKQATVQGKCNINNCTFTQSKGMGLSVSEEAKLLSFKSNNFISNQLAPMQVPVSEVSQIDGSTNFSNGNTYNGIEIIGTSLQELSASNWNKLSNASSYKILESINILSGLTIQAGAVFDMSTGTLLRTTFPNGYISAIGKPNEEIVFKGINSGKGSWKGILFTSSDLKNELTHCIISGAGGGGLITGLSNANIGIFTQSANTGKLKISNCTIEDGAGCGISFDSKSIVTQGTNVFLNLTGANVCN